MNKMDMVKFTGRLEKAFGIESDDGTTPPFYAPSTIDEWLKNGKVQAINITEEFMDYALSAIQNEGGNYPPKQLAGALVRLHAEYSTKKANAVRQDGRDADFMPVNESDLPFNPKCPDCEMGWIHYVIEQNGVRYPAVARCHCYTNTSGVDRMTRDEITAQGNTKILGRKEIREYYG